jgi:uncharacterized Zn finger protein
MTGVPFGDKRMIDQKVKLTCKDCGEAFEVFLREMAEHNRKVTCPDCGKVNEYPATDSSERDRP